MLRSGTRSKLGSFILSEEVILLFKACLWKLLLFNGTLHFFLTNLVFEKKRVFFYMKLKVNLKKNNSFWVRRVIPLVKFILVVSFLYFNQSSIKWFSICDVPSPKRIIIHFFFLNYFCEKYLPTKIIKVETTFLLIDSMIEKRHICSPNLEIFWKKYTVVILKYQWVPQFSGCFSVLWCLILLKALVENSQNTIYNLSITNKK